MELGGVPHGFFHNFSFFSSELHAGTFDVCVKVQLNGRRREVTASGCGHDDSKVWHGARVNKISLIVGCPPPVVSCGSNSVVPLVGDGAGEVDRGLFASGVTDVTISAISVPGCTVIKVIVNTCGGKGR